MSAGVIERGRSHARMSRYALWQLRDYAFERGLPTLLVGALLLLATTIGIRESFGAEWRELPVAGDIAETAFTAMLGTFALLATILATNHVVANDRRRGYYRFLFAKPVRVERFYAQAYLLNGAGFVVVVALVMAGFSALLHPVWLPGAFAVAAGLYVALGGICFLASTLTRFDWLLAAALWMLGRMLRALYPAEHGPAARVLDVLLPPVHMSDPVNRAFLAGELPPAGALAWYLGYGLLAVMAGLLVLRSRSLAS
ncbi:MAG: hypothetical protein ACRENI_13510 [Gemmatimonadaceae bacterium]